jgi:hypothetical protein
MSHEHARSAHRHPAPPPDVFLREAFQISPHVLHRQYALSADFLFVVAIAPDRHAGQTVGTVPDTLGCERSTP